MIKSLEWPVEKLKALNVKQLEQLRDNARKRGEVGIVDACDAELSDRKPQKIKTQKVATNRSDKAIVVGYHFVCQDDRGVSLVGDGTFWSGSWIVAESNVIASIRHGAYLALHNNKIEQSYRQGEIVGFRHSQRSMIAKKNMGIEFHVRADNASRQWIGDGSGEKGYKWLERGEDSSQ